MRMLRRHANPYRTRPFGRAKAYAIAAPERQASTISDDLRIFALTFAGGFLFMAVYLA